MAYGCNSMPNRSSSQPCQGPESTGPILTPTGPANRRPKIVVLDGHTLTASSGPDHGQPIDWSPLEALGHVTVYDRSTPEQAAVRAADTPIVLTNKTPLPAQTLRQLPRLRYIGVLATGVNVVDLSAAARHQIVVTNVPDYSTDSVAQHVFALLLELTNHTGQHDQAARDGRWARCPDFCFTVRPITELAGKTLGVVGLGAIGRRVAQIGSAFGLRIAAAHQSSQTNVQLPGIDVQWLPIDELVAVADVVTLHCPLVEKTRHMINAQRLDRMKRSAVLINTGRGGLIDEEALARALGEHRIAGAGLDVLDTEPPSADHPLLTAANCVITPHVAWASVQAKRRLIERVAENIRSFLAGAPINVVT